MNGLLCGAPNEGTKEQAMSNLREHLEDYTDAAREIELAGVAVTVLEAMRSAEALRAIKMLHRVQQRHLKRLDAAAAKLGAPYPGK